MTATSVMTPTAVTRSWNTVQRVAVLLFALIVLSGLAFVAGRASAPSHTQSTITPTAINLPASGGELAGRCHINRPC
jgi:hypothetical protein